MIHYLNNCQNYNHGRAYLKVCSDAFFDLYTTGRDKKHIPGFQLGDDCIVATKLKKVKSPDNEVQEVVAFTRYRLDRTLKGMYLDKIETLVFCGPQIARQTMTKAEAAQSSQFSFFFNKKGHFKQLSVLNDA